MPQEEAQIRRTERPGGIDELSAEIARIRARTTRATNAQSRTRTRASPSSREIGWRYENAAIIVINTGNVVAKSAKRMITASTIPPYRAANEP